MGKSPHVMAISSVKLCSLRWDVFGSFHRVLSIECCSSAIGDDSAMNVLSKVVISIQAGRDFAPVLAISTNQLFSNTHWLYTLVLTVSYFCSFFLFLPLRVRSCQRSTGDEPTATILGTLTFIIFSYTATIFGTLTCIIFSYTATIFGTLIRFFMDVFLQLSVFIGFSML